MRIIPAIQDQSRQSLSSGAKTDGTSKQSPQQAQKSVTEATPIPPPRNKRHGTIQKYDSPVSSNSSLEKSRPSLPVKPPHLSLSQQSLNQLALAGTPPTQTQHSPIDFDQIQSNVKEKFDQNQNESQDQWRNDDTLVDLQDEPQNLHRDHNATHNKSIVQQLSSQSLEGQDQSPNNQQLKTSDYFSQRSNQDIDSARQIQSPSITLRSANNETTDNSDDDSDDSIDMKDELLRLVNENSKLSLLMDIVPPPRRVNQQLESKVNNNQIASNNSSHTFASSSQNASAVFNASINQSNDSLPVQNNLDEDVNSSLSSLSTNSKNVRNVQQPGRLSFRVSSERDKIFTAFSKKPKKSKTETSIGGSPKLQKRVMSKSSETRLKWYEYMPDGKTREDIMQSLTKEDKVRQEVSYEILTTEEDYINDLKMIVETYIKPLRDKKIKLPPEIADIFSSIEQIIPVNEVFCLEIKRCRTPYLLENIGKAFLTVADYFKLYTMYCGLHSKAVVSLQKAMKSDQQVKSFMRDVYSRPDYNGLNLESYLLKPVQRICKYPLFLRELLKVTGDGHKDRPSLEQAKGKIDDIVTIVNERTKHLESMHQTIEAIKKIKNGAELMQPTRKIVIDGLFIVKSTNLEIGDEPRKCHLFLFNDLLVFTKPSSIIQRDKYTVLFCIDAANISWVDVDDEIAPNGFLIIDNLSSEVYLLMLTSYTEKMKWETQLTNFDIPQDEVDPKQYLDRIHSKQQVPQYSLTREEVAGLMEEKRQQRSRAFTISSDAGNTLVNLEDSQIQSAKENDVAHKVQNDPLFQSILQPLSSLQFVDTDFSKYISKDLPSPKNLE